MSDENNPLQATGPLRPGEQSPAGVVVVPARDDPAPGGPGARIRTDALVIDIRADVLVDGMTRALLDHFRDSLLTGQRADGGGPQAKLGVRAAALPGRVTPHRGARTGFLADHIRRTEIAGDTTQASSRIEPPPERIVYARSEAKLGREFITERGAAGQVAEAAARAIVDDMAAGRGFATDSKAQEAGDV